MTLHYDCTLADLEDNWVEISEVWSRKEMSDLADADDYAAMLGFWTSKIKQMHIITLDGVVITNPVNLTEEILEESLDVRLCDFLGFVMMQACAHLRTLGPLSGQLQSDGVDTKTTKTKA